MCARRAVVGGPGGAGAAPRGGPTAVADPTGWALLWGTHVDWASQTVPQAGAGGRISAWPHGKVLGRSSAINGMVHCRGHQDSYDAWAAAGTAGWDYTSMLPFLKRIENAVDHPGAVFPPPRAMTSCNGDHRGFLVDTVSPFVLSDGPPPIPALVQVARRVLAVTCAVGVFEM